MNPKLLIQEDILSLYFNRGTLVRWFVFDAEGTRALYGIIECEQTNKPGFYYVRDEADKLHSIRWSDLKLAHR